MATTPIPDPDNLPGTGPQPHVPQPTGPKNPTVGPPTNADEPSDAEVSEFQARYGMP